MGVDAIGRAALTCREPPVTGSPIMPALDIRAGFVKV
jgi:hypothetical protein